MEPEHARAHASGVSGDPMVGRLLERRYRIGPRIARGGMASVYEATDTRLDRTVAVKVMHPGLTTLRKPPPATTLRRASGVAHGSARALKTAAGRPPAAS